MDTLTMEGALGSGRVFARADLAALPQQVPDVALLVPGRSGSAVRLRALLDAVQPSPSAAWVTLASADASFALSVPLEAVADAALVVYRLGDEPLPRAQGGPFRLLIVDATACGKAGIDACANVKDLGVIRLTSAREPDVGHAHG